MSNKLWASMVLVLQLSVCGVAAAEAGSTTSGAWTDSLRTLLSQAEADGASGILRVTLAGQVLFESGFGSASCGNNEPVTPEHLFMIGSITKELTQLLAFVLEERGFLSLDDKVSKHLEDFAGPIGEVTLRQLVHHTGGLPDLIDDRGHPVPYSVEYDYEPVTREMLIARAEQVQLMARPGEKEEYSNLGYQLLAAIYEMTTGETYPQLLRRYIFQPAAMTATDFWFADADDRTFADGCRAGNVHWGNPADDGMWGESGPSWNLMGAGGLLSTAQSLGRFFEGLSKSTYFETREQLEKYKASRMVYSERRQQRIMGPAGSNGIFSAVAFWTDEDRFNVILMTNRADHPGERELIRDVIGVFSPRMEAQ